ncbi:MAG: hypothetical protein AB1560_06575 [Pseudomonadota bacterium]
MNKLTVIVCGLAWGTLSALPALAQEAGQAPVTAAEPRELIYCADLMTPAEREAYRARMRAARAPSERAAVRQAHRNEMQARARALGLDTMQCEPLRQRERRRGGNAP